MSLVFQPGFWEILVFRFILEIKQVKLNGSQFVALKHNLAYAPPITVLVHRGS